MADELKTQILVTVLSFWTILLIFSNLLPVSLVNQNSLSNLQGELTTQEFEGDKSFLSGLFSTLDEIPVISYFTPILKIMTFQTTSSIPIWISILLDFIAILTALSLFGLATGK